MGIDKYKTENLKKYNKVLLISSILCLTIIGILLGTEIQAINQD
ncbi:hypothetical protein PP182_12290 [Maribacter sp. PR1]|uniref:Uncharacterized protein n=1 Tax=Maribacter cobaltidurans TaxID=1178778 RepID=A0ABU7IVM9_9FLAO|nr:MULTISPECIES: hypothetical protein [Maribacter]MDC6389467.1 hypothetical protein [Maribacter sp. PR1]MEE1976856.1 hypothetical protein [Maribacter cobaltidurans]